VEVKAEPENNKRWRLSEFLPGKSPNDAPLSHEPVEPVKMEEPEDDDMQRTPSEHYNENSNSSVPEKSDVSLEAEDHPMPPPAKVKSPSKTPEDKTPDTDLSSVFSFIKNLQTIQPISSISDSDDNLGSERPKKKRPKKERPRLPKDIDAADSSSDESSRFSESRGRSSIDESKRGRKNSFPTNPYDTSSDTNSINGAKKAKKSPRKDSQSRKQSRGNRRRPSISRKTIPSTDGSSDEATAAPVVIVKPPKPVKEAKKVPKKKLPKSPEKIATSEDDSEPTKHSPYRQSPPPPVPPPMSSSSSSEHSEDSESCGEARNGSKKIEKIVNDKIKNASLLKVFNVMKGGSEGGKGGKGGAKGKGQVAVITAEDPLPKPSNEFTSATPVIVSIDLARIDLTLLSIPPEKLKNTVIRTKSAAVPIVEPLPPPPQRKSKKRQRSSNHEEQDRWRKPGFDQLSVSSSSSASSEIMDNPAATRIAYTTNYTNDRLNNNIAEHKTKDFYHSPSSVDTKLPKIKKEHRASPLKAPTNDFKNKIKQETMKQEEFDGTQVRARASSMTNNSSHSYKDKKRKRMDGTGENSLPLPPTNHERLPMNGDMMAKPEVVKKVYVSYFERTNDEVEQQEAR
jgi:hypothetical protein